jgi:hypothetical protein
MWPLYARRRQRAGTELFQIAGHIDGDQRIEINRMNRMLAEMS